MGRGRNFIKVLWPFLIIIFLMVGACSKMDGPLYTYTISGKVKMTVDKVDIPLHGVTITMTGGVLATAQTDVNGNYNFTNMPNGTYVLTPSLKGYTFSPSSLTAAVTAANLTVPDFTATAFVTPQYSISGTVNGDVAYGVTINLTSATIPSTTTTDVSGKFSFTGLYNGEYTITPSLTGYKFSPSSLAATVSGADVSGNNFTAAAITEPASRYSISGTVTEAVTNVAKYQVLITLSGDGSATTKTGTSGQYTFSNLVPGNYTLTASLAGYTFSQSFLTDPANIITANLTHENFTATANQTTYHQDPDVTGIWNIHMLTIGSTNKWQYRTATVDSSGNVTFSPLSCLDSAGSTTCPAGTTWAISSGVITDSGDTNMTMTGNKNFIAGTSGVKGGPNATLMILQKDITGGILRADLTIDAASFSVNAANPDFPAGTVVVLIGTEQISGTYSQTTHQFTSCTRGFNGTTAAIHSLGAQVTLIATLTADVTDTTVDHFSVNAANPDFPAGTVVVLIGTEQISGTYSQTTHQFTSCTRGFNGTTAATHSSGAQVIVAPATLTAGVTATVDHFSVNAANPDFPAGAVVVLIDKEQISCTYGTSSFTSCTRGVNGTTAKIHSSGAQVTCLVYTTGDLNNKAFVFHQLSVGSNNEWRHGEGYTSTSGSITMNSETGPNDSTNTFTGSIVLSADNNGVVTMNSADNTNFNGFNGFLADDKKTIVGTYTDNAGNYKLMIIQMTAQTYPVGALPAGTSTGHMLAGGVSPVPLWNQSSGFWAYYTATVNSTGTMALSSSVSSSASVNLNGQSFPSSINDSGTVTLAGDFHGQASDDGKFIVGTETYASGVHALIIYTK